MIRSENRDSLQIFDKILESYLILFRKLYDELLDFNLFKSMYKFLKNLIELLYKKSQAK